MPNEGPSHDHQDHNGKRHKPQPPEQALQGLEGAREASVDAAVAFQRATCAPPPAVSPNDILSLQRTVGNEAVGRILAERKGTAESGGPLLKPFLQAKLTVNPPGDTYEREADRMAGKVMGRISASRTESAQRQEEEEEELQTKPVNPVQRQEEEIQMRPAAAIRRSGAGSAPEVDAETEGRIDAARGGGESLDQGTREPMERAFGADFSAVRVHTDGQANELSQSLRARAFTTGQDIFFRSGEYSPESPSGQQLLAHELTHSIQQSGKVDRIAKWGNPPGMDPPGTTHIAVTEKAFEALKKDHPEYEIWYSPGAQKHLAKRSEDMDLRFGFLMGSFGVGAWMVGPSYKLWRKIQKGSMNVARWGRGAWRGLRRLIGWTGEKLGLTEEQKAQAELEQERRGHRRGDIKRGIWRGLRRGIGWLGEKLGLTKGEAAEAKELLRQGQADRLEERAAHDYDNLSWYWRSASEAPNHAESGMYRNPAAGGETEKRVEEYLESAKKAYHSGNPTHALQILGLALHTAEDRGAHSDGAPGTGHDPRRIMPPPPGATTGHLYNPNLKTDGKECDREDANPDGYKVGVNQAAEVLRRFLEKIGVFAGGELSPDAPRVGGKLSSYGRPWWGARLLRGIANFFGRDIERFRSKARGIK